MKWKSLICFRPATEMIKDVACCVTALSDEQLQSYHTDGFLSGLRILSLEDAQRVRLRFDELERREGAETSQIGLLDRHFEESFIMEIAANPTIVRFVERIFDSEVLLLATHFFCKYGGSKGQVAWHQDVTYWNLDPPAAITAWYAVDDADEENGCMRVIPGTHRGGIREHGKSAREGNLLSVNQEVLVSDEEESRAVDLPLTAGEISLHDGMLIHGSLPNRSDRRRCGLTLRYVPSRVRFGEVGAAGRPWRPISVRGL